MVYLDPRTHSSPHRPTMGDFGLSSHDRATDDGFRRTRVASIHTATADRQALAEVVAAALYRGPPLAVRTDVMDTP